MASNDVKNFIRSYLSRRTPDGYFVVPAKLEALNYLKDLENMIIYEIAGNIVFIKVKSRSLGERIIRRLYRLKLIA